jgi:hypothetical protein
MFLFKLSVEILINDYIQILHNMKVLHLPCTVGGNPHSISTHLRYIGVKSESWTLQGNYFDFPADKKIVSNRDNLITVEIKKILALRYVFFYDVIFFNFGSTLFKPVTSGPKRYCAMALVLF